MKKVAVTVRVPAIGQQHDFIIPDTMMVRDALKLMVEILASEYGVSDDGADLMLFDKSDGKALQMTYSFSQQGIADGAKLVMF